MMIRRHRAILPATRLVAVLAAAAALSVACSSEQENAVSAPATAQAPTADSATAAQPTPTGEQTARAAVRTTSTAAKPSKTSTKKQPPSKPLMIKVPDGVGLDYQSAQDLWRAAGLHVAPATDATGAHRLPLIDANWVVLAQNLKAGSKVPIDSFIRATVKKYSDD
jgi:hypothetical protein